MSTVQTIYNSIQYRPDIKVEADDLIHVVNMAVRAIAKRLYVLESSLITDQMEVSIFAEDSYTASIAIISTGFTDAASQFVIEGFVKDMPISTTDTTNTGIYRISTAVAGTITTVETLTAVGAASMTITSDDSFGYLPSDFWGLADKPYISGKKYPLLPLPSVDTELQYTTGDPLFYKVKGTRIYVTPHTGSDYTIIADYFVKPTELTLTTSTIPFNELFDDLIAEYVMRYFRGKPTQAEALILKDMINDGVDLVASKYDKCAAPTPSGISWSNVE